MEILLRRRSGGVLLHSGAHAPHVRSAPVLAKHRRLTHRSEFPNRLWVQLRESVIQLIVMAENPVLVEGNPPLGGQIGHDPGPRAHPLGE